MEVRAEDLEGSRAEPLWSSCFWETLTGTPRGVIGIQAFLSLMILTATVDLRCTQKGWVLFLI